MHPLYEKLDASRRLKNGTKEILAATAVFNMNKVTGFVDFKSRQTNRDYAQKEFDWYLSEKLTPPKGIKVWDRIKSKHGKINSNYGYLVFSHKNGDQFKHARTALESDMYTRQSVIIYNRPAIHTDWCKDGMHDFICTFYQQFFIRDNKLHCIVNMRSNDCIFGTFNDIPWFEYVYYKMYNALTKGNTPVYPGLKMGTMTFIANSFHCYERHFSVLHDIAVNK